MIASIDEGLDEIVETAPRESPPAVLLASVFGFVKAGFLAFIGIIGVAAWDDVTNPWGSGRSCSRRCSPLPPSRSMVAAPCTMVLAALAVIGGVIALVYVFVGPTSAILPSLVTVALDAVLVWLVRLAGREGLLRFVADDVRAKIGMRRVAEHMPCRCQQGGR